MAQQGIEDLRAITILQRAETRMHHADHAPRIPRRTIVPDHRDAVFDTRDAALSSADIRSRQCRHMRILVM
ncbi:MAG: hypothetical protein IPI27_12335 [Betaproteobacteria bacterium]|nr:hypothetical protein [Betaproteobacteria bacterium]